MVKSIVRFYCMAGVMGLAAASCASALAVEKLSGVEARAMGKRIFERQWTYKDLYSGRGDGLGPMYNANSCAACHHQQGSGGGGDARHNVDLLTIVDFAGHDKKAPSRESLERLHPSFKTANSITLHSASTQGDYEAYRAALLGAGPSRVRPFGDGSTGPPIQVKLVSFKGKVILRWDDFALQRSQRNTPSLFGAGVIDKISDTTLSELSARKGPNRVAAFGSVRGRFGSKGQTRTLRDFVIGACANELGLQAKGSPQAPDPTRPEYERTRVDMTPQQIDALVTFVASLPPPPQLAVTDRKRLLTWLNGSSLFVKAQCHSCHVPDVGDAQGIYSDLQLHDMGPELSDPTGRALTLLPVTRPAVPAASGEAVEDPDLVSGSSSSLGGSSSAPYYGPSLAELAALWRTPPLWGVRYTAPYLHDGRAETLEEAIAMHGGQAQPSAERFIRMSKSERGDLVDYVYSLGAPKQP